MKTHSDPVHDQICEHLEAVKQKLETLIKTDSVNGPIFEYMCEHVSAIVTQLKSLKLEPAPTWKSVALELGNLHKDAHELNCSCRACRAVRKLMVLEKGEQAESP